MSGNWSIWKILGEGFGETPEPVHDEPNVVCTCMTEPGYRFGKELEAVVNVWVNKECPVHGERNGTE